MYNTIPIIIPSLEPDDRFLNIIEKLYNAKLGPLVVVNDGSSEKYNHYFDTAREEYSAIILQHDRNRGKGRALKTAFEYCLDTYDGLLGVVTADSDGQHDVESITKIIQALHDYPEKLILGVRDFEGSGIPAKSQFGNNLTRKVFKSLYKKDITDTQTGLRGIPKVFMQSLLSVPGERFEFETRMLVEAVEKEVDIQEIPVTTIYDSADNHSTHFRPVADSIKIYRIFGAAFLRFLVSGLSSSLLDLALFQLLCWLLRGHNLVFDYVVLATIFARLCSATYNYTVNYYYVFRSQKTHSKSLIRYVTLAILQMFCSGVLTSTLVQLVGASLELLVKIPVDVLLFFISYRIQKRFVY